MQNLPSYDSKQYIDKPMPYVMNAWTASYRLGSAWPFALHTTFPSACTSKYVLYWDSSFFSLGSVGLSMPIKSGAAAARIHSGNFKC